MLLKYCGSPAVAAAAMAGTTPADEDVADLTQTLEARFNKLKPAPAEEDVADPNRKMGLNSVQQRHVIHKRLKEPNSASAAKKAAAAKAAAAAAATAAAKAAAENAAAEKEVEAKAAAEKAATALAAQQRAVLHRQPSMREVLITALASSNSADLKAALDTALAMGLAPTSSLATLATQQLAALTAKEATQHQHQQRETARQQALEALSAALAGGAAAAELESAAAAARNAGVSPDDASLKAVERALSGARLLKLFERPPGDLDWAAAVKVGAGGFGNVYRVSCAGIVVAAKKLQMDTQAAAMEMLKRETRVLAKALRGFKLCHALPA